MPNGDTHKPVTDDDSFDIEEATYSVETSKEFNPAKIVGGNAADIGSERNSSTVSLGLKNGSNQPLSKLNSLSEQAGDTDAFNTDLVFDGFQNITWPEGAENEPSRSTVRSTR